MHRKCTKKIMVHYYMEPILMRTDFWITWDTSSSHCTSWYQEHRFGEATQRLNGGWTDENVDENAKIYDMIMRKVRMGNTDERADRVENGDADDCMEVGQMRPDHPRPAESHPSSHPSAMESTIHSWWNTLPDPFSKSMISLQLLSMLNERDEPKGQMMKTALPSHCL